MRNTERIEMLEVLKFTRKRSKARKFSKNVFRGIIRKGRAGGYTARILHSHFQLSVTIRRVLQTLSSAEYCSFEKRKKASFLTLAHRPSRLNKADNFLEKSSVFWRKEILVGRTGWCKLLLAWHKNQTEALLHQTTWREWSDGMGWDMCTR